MYDYNDETSDLTTNACQSVGNLRKGLNLQHERSQARRAEWAKEKQKEMEKTYAVYLQCVPPTETRDGWQ